MNRKEIKKKYPKAYQLWRKWGYYFNTQDKGRIRRLYDFFDEQGIFIMMNRSPADKEFFWSIDIGHDYQDGNYTTTRKESEEQAFLKAFSILEENLRY